MERGLLAGVIMLLLMLLILLIPLMLNCQSLFIVHTDSVPHYRRGRCEISEGVSETSRTQVDTYRYYYDCF
jgi:hypothetical protein